MGSTAQIGGASICHLAIPLLLLVAGFLHAEQLPIKAYTSAEGLAHNHINRIRQDSRGYLWFCTDGGLTRFDGHDFASYTTQDGIPHAWINDLLIGRDNTYWVATDRGIAQFSPTGVSPRAIDANPRSSHLPMFVAVGPETGDGGERRVNALAEDTDGSILCATYAGLYRLQRAGSGWSFHAIEMGLRKEIREGELVNNLSPSRQGGWWIAARYGLFHLSTKGKSEQVTSVQGLLDRFVEAVSEDRNGILWAGTRTAGLCAVRRTSISPGWTMERCYSVADGLPDNDVRSILQLHDGTLWIGTASGLSEAHPTSRGLRFRNYTVDNGLSDSHILKLAEDAEGNLWIGTAVSGVMKLIRQGFDSFDSRNGFLSAMNHESIFETIGGELSIVSEVRGKIVVQILDRGRFRRIDPALPIVRGGNPGRSGSFQDQIGEWWIGTGQGLFRFSRVGLARDLGQARLRGVYTTSAGFAGDNIDVLYEDSRGDVWISTNSASAHSLNRWQRSSNMLRDYTQALPLLKQKRASAFGEDTSGNIWIGLIDDGGIVRYRHGQFQAVAAPQRAFSGLVRAIYPDRSGRMWVATSRSGLVRIDGANLDGPHLQPYTLAEGLSSNDVYCITQDEFGQIYVGTSSGVDRLDPASGLIRRFTIADGLAQGAVVLARRDRIGALWFVTNKGVSRLIPAHIQPPSEPRVLIHRLRILGEPYPISELGETALSGIVISPERNTIQMDFSAPDFRLGSPVQYQYRLEGASLGWGPLSSEHSVHFANLAPGDYRFLVRAVASHVVGPSASVSFRVVPPFWRQWWFLNGASILTAAALYVLHQMRLRRAMEIERVRTRIATDLHDDIGSSLSQIAILSEVVGQSFDGHHRAEREVLSRIAGTSRELIQSMSDIVWAINPEKDHLRDLSLRMRRFASDMLTARCIDFTFRAPGPEQDIRVGADFRRHVFLIFKESVNNIVEHSGCSRAFIDFALEKHSLVLRIQDNGKGLDLSECETGHGLASMRARAGILRGALEVRSGQGTEVCLRVPLGRLTRECANKNSYRSG
jgi:ligand-binding sensor domain-containing protein/signal transduction histidine kinase